MKHIYSYPPALPFENVGIAHCAVRIHRTKPKISRYSHARQIIHEISRRKIVYNHLRYF